MRGGENLFYNLYLICLLVYLLYAVLIFSLPEWYPRDVFDGVVFSGGSTNTGLSEVHHSISI